MTGTYTGGAPAPPVDRQAKADEDAAYRREGLILAVIGLASGLTCGVLTVYMVLQVIAP